MTPMKARGFVAFMAAGLLAAGCGGGSSTVTAPNTPKQIAADKATVEQALLTSADLPSGYTGTPHDNSTSDDPPAAVENQFVACSGFPKRLLDQKNDDQPHADAPDFSQWHGRPGRRDGARQQRRARPVLEGRQRPALAPHRRGEVLRATLPSGVQEGFGRRSRRVVQRRLRRSAQHRLDRGPVGCVPRSRHGVGRWTLDPDRVQPLLRADRTCGSGDDRDRLRARSSTRRSRSRCSPRWSIG